MGLAETRPISTPETIRPVARYLNLNHNNDDLYLYLYLYF